MKNKKKSTLIGITSVILASLVACFSACSNSEKNVSDEIGTTTPVAATEEIITEAEETVIETEAPTEEQDDHMAAYNKFLKNYNGGEFYDSFRFELVYFTDDSIPELFVSENDAHAGTVKIFTYADGEVVELYEGGSWGSISYVKRESVVVEEYMNQGIIMGSVVKVNTDGTAKTLFSYEDNAGYYPPDSDMLSFIVNDEEVSEEEYNKAVRENVPQNTESFYEGISMTIENIDKYCR